MQCGAPATTTVKKKFTAAPIPDPIPVDNIVGWLFLPIWAFFALLIAATRKTIVVRTPLCHKHAHGWFLCSTLNTKTLTNDRLTLSGVSDKFVAALEAYRADRSSR